ncbi:SDR family NAD(P)-dependent oxidoreductase [Gracilibacillus salinarum]|uniref:SDR family oxidoreductase n=1 Tax=Gracilibacillus salinarum TaxID=2932255 RepID=A0ABY4GQW8_9BACI|nr:SDR family oxidoreductase [Gracilibacillus salinarum]UOQ86664.1 SDR family oxidoreductase [Gracilibacillus salinarum]
MRYQNKVVLVTGGANGIGAAIVQAYLAEGAQVIIADTQVPSDKQAVFIKTDVSKMDEVERLFTHIRQHYQRLDILINNAGVSKFKDFFTIGIEDWENVINTNLRGAFFCAQQAAQIMKEQSIAGSLIQIASTRAFMSEANTECYSVSKGGLFSLTHALAMTLQDDHITSNAISPGWIQTEDYHALRDIDHQQHPSKRVGKPEDVARACLFLTDPSNTFINGENLMIDGGMTRKMIYEH